MISEILQARDKLDKAVNVYRKIYITARSTWSGLQNVITEEASRTPPARQDRDGQIKDFLQFSAVFEQDVKM